MKKFLVILMVLAMASFLFVGCTTPVEEEVAEEEEVVEEEEEVVVAATVAPVLLTVAGISLTSSATQYINATEAAVVVVTGTAPTYSEVKVYVDDVCAGTADVGVTGTFSVTVAEADLGADGDKVLYATAKEAAIDVSAHSTEYAFVLDQVKPTATTLAATTAATDSAIRSTLATSGAFPIQATFTAVGSTAVAGTWTVNCLGDSSETSNVVVTTPAGVATTYTIGTANMDASGVIPGYTFDFVTTFAAGDSCTVAVTAAIADRATVLFDEDVTYASAMAATYTWYNQSDADVPTATPYAYQSNTQYFRPFATNGPDRYDLLQVIVNGAIDLAGNTQTVANVLTCTVGAASATSLAP